uniref:Uncharacterized protein n=1 Tax=Quercus lobata TaxID=97700 RepID=A0A7N2L7U2_QUELO
MEQRDPSNPSFLLSKASPLSTVDSTSFSKLVAQNLLSTHLPAFCSFVNLLCFPDLAPSLEKHDKDLNFAGYADRNFTNYGTDLLGTCRWTRFVDIAGNPLFTRTTLTTTHQMETWWTRVSMGTSLAPPAVLASSRSTLTQ